MLALIMEQGYDEINIQAVTDKANLGRATFYLHYKEKDDLLGDVIQQLIEQFIEQSPQLITSQWRLDDIKSIQKLFEFAEANYELYRIMIFSKGSITASRQLHQIIATNMENALENEIESTGMESLLPVHFMANYFAGALLATIFWWLDNELPYNAEEMASMYQEINLVNRAQLLKQSDARSIVTAFIEGRIDRARGRDKRAQKAQKSSAGKETRRDKRRVKGEPVEPVMPEPEAMPVKPVIPDSETETTESMESQL